MRTHTGSTGQPSLTPVDLHDQLLGHTRAVGGVAGTGIGPPVHEEALFGVTCPRVNRLLNGR